MCPGHAGALIEPIGGCGLLIALYEYIQISPSQLKSTYDITNLEHNNLARKIYTFTFN